MEGWRSELWYRFNFCWVWTTFTLALSYRSTGHRHVPKRGPVLVLANHESYLDPLAAGLAVRRPIYFLAKKPLFRHPTFGAYLRSVRCVPVDQEGVAKEGLKTSIELLQGGKALLVFPEGSRSLDGKMVPFKPGIALILKRTPVPIVPVGVAGAFEAYPLTASMPRICPMFWPNTGAAVAAAVGPVIPPQRYQNMGRDELLRFLFDAVAEQVERAENLKRKG